MYINQHLDLLFFIMLHTLPEMTLTLDSTTAIELFRPSRPLMKMYDPFPSVTKYQ